MKTLVVQDRTLTMDDDVYEFLKDKVDAIRTNNRRYPILYLHKMFHTATSQQPQVDHINGDRFDFRRSNLRLASQSQNQANRPRQKNKTSSIYKGVYRAQNGTFQARVHVAGTKNHQKTIGTFGTQEEAARAYDLAAIYYYGEFARTNFATESYHNIDIVEEIRKIFSRLPFRQGRRAKYQGILYERTCTLNPWRVRFAGICKSFSDPLTAARWRDDYIKQNKLHLTGFKLNFPTHVEIIEILNSWKPNIFQGAKSCMRM